MRRPIASRLALVLGLVASGFAQRPTSATGGDANALALEDAEARARLPEFMIIPAATAEELTPAAPMDPTATARKRSCSITCFAAGRATAGV
jgi:hypothetical protein